MLQGPVQMIRTFSANLALGSPTLHRPSYSLHSHAHNSTSAPRSSKMVAIADDEFDEKLSPIFENDWDKLCRLGSACARLARLHTLMAWAIFPAPAVYTVILYHSATNLGALNPIEKVLGCTRISLMIFACVMSYRAAGLAWDDAIDRDYDARVRRSMTRPLPAGDIHLDYALLYIACQTGFTIILMEAIAPSEVLRSFLVSAALFTIYPYLKRWTHYTQVYGAILIAMGVIQGWLACATLYDPVPGYSAGWSHIIAILRRDWSRLLPIFLMEFVYELAHELIYGCQDTGEDVLIGLRSLSIMCGYDNSRKLGTCLIVIFTGLLSWCAYTAGVMGWQICYLPCFWLAYSTSQLDLTKPTLCGNWATSAIKLKVIITALLMGLFIFKEFDILAILSC